MAMLSSEGSVEPLLDRRDRDLRDQWIRITERLTDSPRLDAGVDRELAPIGKDRGMLTRFVIIDLMVAGAVAGAAELNRGWLIAPLMVLLFVTLGLIVGMMKQLLSDPIG